MKISQIISGKKAIQLFGGEPLLPKNKPFVEGIFAYSKAKDFPVAITTNGTTILHYKDLIERYKDVIKMTQITIDGPPVIHDKRRVPRNGQPTFDLIIQGIEFLLSCGIGVHARVNVDKTNVNSLPELAVFLRKRGLLKKKGFRCVLAPVANHCTKDQSASLLDENELLSEIENLACQFPEIKVLSTDKVPKTVRHLQSILNGGYSSPRFSYCEANRNGYFVFAPDGYIYACSEAAGHKELAIGQFIPAFKLDEEKLKAWSNRTILTLEKCAKCQIAPLCGGGCTYAAYSINGDTSNAYCHQADKVIKNYLKQHKGNFLAKIKKSAA